MEESQLVEQIKKGSREAFDRLYEKYMNTAVRMAYLITGNLADSEDVVQESFVKAYLHMQELKDNNGFKAWFFQILTRTSWQYCKRKAKEVADDEIYQKADRSDRTDSLDRVLQTEQSIAICNAIRKLGVKHRSVIVLYYYNQMSTKEIAKICECMEGTVKSRLFIARNQLKELLKEQIKEDSEKGEDCHEEFRTGNSKSVI